MRLEHGALLIVLTLVVAGCSSDRSGQAEGPIAPSPSASGPASPAGSTTATDTPSADSAGDPAGSETTSEPAPSSSGSRDQDVPSTVKSPGPRVVVSGVVDEGVEAGCLILAGYELIVDSALWHSVLISGEPVEVTGYVDLGRLSYCQQGQPLVVADVRPASR